MSANIQNEKSGLTPLATFGQELRTSLCDGKMVSGVTGGTGWGATKDVGVPQIRFGQRLDGCRVPRGRCVRVADRMHP